MIKFVKTYYGFVPLLLLCIYYCYKSYFFQIHDFSNYYFGAYFFSDGQFDSSLYFPHIFNLEIAKLGYSNLYTSYAPNTPFLALLFTPLTVFNLIKAKLIFNGLSAVLFIISIYKLSQFYNLKPYVIIALPFLFFIPLKNNFLFGQVYILVFFLLTEFWLAYMKNKHYKSVLFLSIAILLKVFPVLFLFLFIFKKEYKPIFICLASCTVLLVLTAMLSSFNVWYFWGVHVFSKASNGEISGMFVDNYQSLFMFLKRVFVFNTHKNSTVLFESILLFKYLILLVKVAVLIMGYFVTKNEKHNPLKVFSFWVLMAVLLSPYGSTYSLIPLVFVAIYFNGLNTQKRVLKNIFFLLLFLVNNLPLSVYLAFSFPFSYMRLICYLYMLFLFFKTVEMHGVTYKNIVLTPLFISLLSVWFFYTSPHNEVEDVLADSPILVYDYTLKTNVLSYTYWSENGPRKSEIPLKYNVKKSAKIINNQVFVNNKQQTVSGDNKLKPMLVNDSIIIYLTDVNKGIGFYALKKMKLK